MDVLRYAKLVPLLGKNLTDLSVADLDSALKALNISVTINEELRQAGLALLQGKGIDTVADLIQSTEALQQLISLMTEDPAALQHEKLVRCGHCNEFMLVKV